MIGFAQRILLSLTIRLWPVGKIPRRRPNCVVVDDPRVVGRHPLLDVGQATARVVVVRLLVAAGVRDEQRRVAHVPVRQVRMDPNRTPGRGHHGGPQEHRGGGGA